jgi:hypothetical protein
MDDVGTASVAELGRVLVGDVAEALPVPGIEGRAYPLDWESAEDIETASVKEVGTELPGDETGTLPLD